MRTTAFKILENFKYDVITVTKSTQRFFYKTFYKILLLNGQKKFTKF